MDTFANVLFVVIVLVIIWIKLSNKFGKDKPVYLESPVKESVDQNYHYHDPSWDNKPNVGKPSQSGAGRTSSPITPTGRPSAWGGDKVTDRVAGAMNRLEEITGRSVHSVKHHWSKQDFIFTDGHGLSKDVVSIAGTPCEIVDDNTIRIKT